MVQLVTPLNKDPQLEAARTPPNSVEAEQSVLADCCSTMPPGIASPMC